MTESALDMPESALEKARRGLMEECDIHPSENYKVAAIARLEAAALAQGEADHDWRRQMEAYGYDSVSAVQAIIEKREGAARLAGRLEQATWDLEHIPLSEAAWGLLVIERDRLRHEAEGPAPLHETLICHECGYQVGGLAHDTACGHDASHNGENCSKCYAQGGKRE